MTRNNRANPGRTGTDAERGESLWLRQSPGPATDCAIPEHVDVAVLGGGIAGVSTALWLARGGARVAIFEAGRLASRASGRNDGQILLGMGEHYHRIVNQLGPERTKTLWDFIGRNHRDLRTEAAIDSGAQTESWHLRFDGGLRLAATEHEFEELSESAAALAADGVEHRLLTKAALAGRLPVASGFHGALALADEGVVQPVRLVEGLADRARQAGATVHTGCPIQRVDGSAGGFEVRLGKGRCVRAEIVVHCTAALGRPLDRSGFLARQVFGFRGQILVSERLRPDLAERFDNTAMSTNFGYEYFRMHDQRFVIGGMRWSVPGEEVHEVDDSVRNPTIDERLRQFVSSHFPALNGTAFNTGWTGIMAGTEDGLPLLGQLPGRPGEFTLCAFNGYGLSCAFAGGQLLAELVLEGRSSSPASALFAPRRFALRGTD